MTVAVIDASALADSFIVGSKPAAARLLSAFALPDPPLELVVPDLVYPETANALRKAALHGGATSAAVERAVERIVRLPLIPVGMKRLLPRAWSLRGTMTIQDAMYAALAREAGVPLVTSDRRFAKAASREGVTALVVGSKPLDVFLSALGV